MTLINCLPLPMMIVAKRSPKTDNAKHQCLMPLSESTSLPQNVDYIVPNPKSQNPGRTHDSIRLSKKHLECQTL
jgi:hypothetical protein